MTQWTRRKFLRSSAKSAAGFWLASSAVQSIVLGSDGIPTGFRPSAYLRIESNNRITFYVTRSEMGQGIRTVLPMIVAEELEVNPASLILRQASLARIARRRNPLLGARDRKESSR